MKLEKDLALYSLCNDPPVPAENPCLVFLHGFPDTPFSFSYQFAALKESFKILACFLPGVHSEEALNYRSEWSLKRAYQLDALLYRWSASIQSFVGSEQKIVLIGHDLGTVLAHELSKIHRSQVLGRICINGMALEQFAGRMRSISQLKKSLYMLPFQWGGVAKKVLEWGGEGILKRIYRAGGLLENDFMNENGNTVYSSIFLYRELLKCLLKKRDHKFVCPDLFIWGEDDPFLNTPSLDELDRYYKDYELRVLSGAHWVHRECGAEVSRIIESSVKKWIL